MINCLKTKRNKSWMYFMTLKQKFHDLVGPEKMKNSDQNVVVIVLKRWLVLYKWFLLQKPFVYYLAVI